MQIESKYKTEITKELNYVVTAMKTEKNLERKIYLYSGAYSMINRILNIEYKPELLFINFVLERSYETINGGITSLIRGETRVPMPNPEVLMNKLADEIKKLAEAISGKGDYIKILTRIIELSYTTTGNGAYLFSKGIIKA